VIYFCRRPNCDTKPSACGPAPCSPCGSKGITNAQKGLRPLTTDKNVSPPQRGPVVDIGAKGLRSVPVSAPVAPHPPPHQSSGVRLKTKSPLQILNGPSTKAPVTPPAVPSSTPAAPATTIPAPTSEPDVACQAQAMTLLTSTLRTLTSPTAGSEAERQKKRQLAIQEYKATLASCPRKSPTATLLDSKHVAPAPVPRKTQPSAAVSKAPTAVTSKPPPAPPVKRSQPLRPSDARTQAIARRTSGHLARARTPAATAPSNTVVLRGPPAARALLRSNQISSAPRHRPTAPTPPSASPSTTAAPVAPATVLESASGSNTPRSVAVSDPDQDLSLETAEESTPPPTTLPASTTATSIVASLPVAQPTVPILNLTSLATPSTPTQSGSATEESTAGQASNPEDALEMESLTPH